MFFSESAVWGHRGWPSKFPDNTEAGIRAAATVAAGVEIDIRSSADDRLVLSHDPRLGGLVVGETPWHRLAVVDLDGYTPALLDDVADLTVTLNFEVKNDPREPGFDPSHRIARLVADRMRPGDVVSSFWWPSIDAVRLSHPDVATGLLLWGPVDPLSAIHHAVDRGHGAIVPAHDQVDAGLMERARREGLRVVTWTVNEPAEATRLAALGVDAIITDRPGELIAEQPEGTS